MPRLQIRISSIKRYTHQAKEALRNEATFFFLEQNGSNQQFCEMVSLSLSLHGKTKTYRGSKTLGQEDTLMLVVQRRCNVGECRDCQPGEP